jgi:uncharacterized protein
MVMLPLILLGLATGVFAGALGLGGGAMLVPALVYFFGFSQHQAQGTTLAMMVPPIGILAAWTYYKHGFIDFKAAGILVVGFILGGLIGAKIAVLLPTAVLKKVFGVAISLIGIKMIFS